MENNLTEDYPKPFDIMVVSIKDHQRLTQENPLYSTAYAEGMGVRIIFIGMDQYRQESYTNFSITCFNKSPNVVCREQLEKDIPQEWFSFLDSLLGALVRVGIDVSNKERIQPLIAIMLFYIIWTKKEGIFCDHLLPEVYSKVYGAAEC
jgi:hypothetical protein